MSKNGGYNERNPYSMVRSPRNRLESEQYANALSASGFYPQGVNGCFTVGISGGCGVDCWIYQEGNCQNPGEIEE
jgi:hypothetical protein